MMIQKEIIIKKRISKKTKINDNKIEQNKAQYNLDRKTAKIFALSSANINKYDFLTEKDVLPEKDLKKRFENYPLVKELKK